LLLDFVDISQDIIARVLVGGFVRLVNSPEVFLEACEIGHAPALPLRETVNVGLEFIDGAMIRIGPTHPSTRPKDERQDEQNNRRR